MLAFPREVVAPSRVGTSTLLFLNGNITLYLRASHRNLPLVSLSISSWIDAAPNASVRRRMRHEEASSRFQTSPPTSLKPLPRTQNLDTQQFHLFFHPLTQSQLLTPSNYNPITHQNQDTISISNTGRVIPKFRNGNFHPIKDLLVYTGTSSAPSSSPTNFTYKLSI
ncbi:hypothetical protein BDZ45DRAFT_69029 [Acephala macrosclerotiorum]|nr:hypothetical protein BDZ45DRAFT_69029 [Acephala macrosclerotiorum]